MTNNENDFLGKGWSFPPSFAMDTQSVTMTEKNEDVQKSLQILLTTTVGERVMQPKYGCNLEEWLFESLNTTTKSLIKDKVKTAILYFESRIQLNSVEIGKGDTNAGELLIEVDYTIRATNSRFNFVFPFYRNEGTELSFLTTTDSGSNSAVSN